MKKPHGIIRSLCLSVGLASLLTLYSCGTSENITKASSTDSGIPTQFQTEKDINNDGVIDTIVVNTTPLERNVESADDDFFKITTYSGIIILSNNHRGHTARDTDNHRRYDTLDVNFHELYDDTSNLYFYLRTGNRASERYVLPKSSFHSRQ